MNVESKKLDYTQSKIRKEGRMTTTITKKKQFSQMECIVFQIEQHWSKVVYCQRQSVVNLCWTNVTKCTIMSHVVQSVHPRIQLDPRVRFQAPVPGLLTGNGHWESVISCFLLKLLGNIQPQLGHLVHVGVDPNVTKFLCLVSKFKELLSMFCHMHLGIKFPQLVYCN